MLLILTCLVYLFAVSDEALGVSTRNIHIDPVHGNDTLSCLVSNSANDSCRTLSWAFNVTHRANATTYMLATGTHYLNESTATFQNLENITFLGGGSSYTDTTILCTTNDTGLAFENVTNIEFSRLKIFNCSALRNSTSRDYGHGETYASFEFQVALYFYSCQNVSMNFVNVDHSPGATGVVMYDTVGTNVISNSVFSNNNVTAGSPGGGGFYVEFTYCVPGDINCQNDNTVSLYTNQNTDSIYRFESCLFTKNRANHSETVGQHSTYIIPHRADHVAFGRGGGLSIFMKGNASNNIVYVSNTNFTENAALWGGGLFVEFHDDTSNNTVLVSHSRMEQNECYFDIESGTGGGGMRIGHYVFEGHEVPNPGNRITLDTCSFLHNAALNGGGLSMSLTAQNGASDQVVNIDVIDTNFEQNYAKLGAALNIDRFVIVLDGNIPTVNLDDCTFIANTVEYTHYLYSRYGYNYNAYQLGVGAVYVNQIPVVFKNMVLFRSNIGSALTAIGVSLDFTNCHAHFTQNKGSKGGAISLLGVAFLKIDDNTSMVFSENTATINGGAIYNNFIERETLVSYDNCFIRHVNFFISPENWNSTFQFYDNYDQGGTRTSAIHTTSILPCTWAGGSKNKKTFCWNKRWIYYPTNCSEQINSDVGKITFDSPEDPDSNHVTAFPGHTFRLPISIKDDLTNNVSNLTVFSAVVDSYDRNYTTQYVWGRDADVAVDTDESNVTLLLDTIGSAVWHVNLVIELQPCPPGFKKDSEGTKCICTPEGSYSGALTCNPITEKAYLKEDNWMGKLNISEKYLVTFCPPKFCFSGLSHPLPNSTDRLDLEICGPFNRTNTMCGECLTDFGVAVNTLTYECINCTNEDIGANTLKYIAAVYIPLTVLFSAIVLLNIRLTSGPANAFILYSQVIASTFDLSADGQIPISRITHDNQTAFNLLQGYRIPYGIFNLQFIERFIPPLCLGHLNTLDALLLDYAVALYPLVMIVIVLICFKLKECLSSLCRYGSSRPLTNQNRLKYISVSRRSRWNVNEAILPAFAAFLLLSYNKFSTTSAYITSTEILQDENGNQFGPVRAYYAGHLSYQDPQYQIKYLLPACIVYATFVAIPPLLLLDLPIKLFEWCVSRVDCLWSRYPAVKVQILLDTFQGCYKNKMRFFSGLYFVFRIVINVSYIETDTWFSQYVVQQIACVIMVSLLAICQPYNEENKIFNIVDILIFTNLGILNAISFYLYSLSQSNTQQVSLPASAFVVQYALVYLPIVYMVGYVTWYFIKPYKQKIKFIGRKLKAHVFQRGMNRPMTDIVADGVSTTDINYRSSSDGLAISQQEEEALLERAEEENRYRPPSRASMESSRNSTRSTGDEPRTQSSHPNTIDSGVRSSLTTTTSRSYGSMGSTSQSSYSTEPQNQDSTHPVQKEDL